MGHAWMQGYLAESAAAMQGFMQDAALQATLVAMAGQITDAMRAGGKLLIAGNGGSAGDAQHIAGEFVSRLHFDRAPLAAIALTTDSSVLTAIGNDYGFAAVFERQVRGLGRPGDVLLGISTSGKSPNVLHALAAGRSAGLHTLAFCGADPAGMVRDAGMLFCAPSRRTAVVQQVHIVAGHILCGLVERALFPEEAAQLTA